MNISLPSRCVNGRWVRTPAFSSVIVGAGVPPAHQSRTGWIRVSERQWNAPVCEAGSALPGFPEHRPSGSPPATQRRTIGAVARGMIEGLRPRRWHAGGLLRGRNSCTGRRLPGGAPLDVFRDAIGCVSARPRKTSRTARPVGRHMPADSGANPARPGERGFPRALVGLRVRSRVRSRSRVRPRPRPRPRPQNPPSYDV